MGQKLLLVIAQMEAEDVPAIIYPMLLWYVMYKSSNMDFLFLLLYERSCFYSFHWKWQGYTIAIHY